MASGASCGNGTPYRTHGWNIVFVPYCTGDVHTGNATAVYSDADPSKPLAYVHRGRFNPILASLGY